MTERTPAEVREWARKWLAMCRGGDVRPGVAALHFDVTLGELLRLADLAEAQAAELDRARQVGMWFDAIRFALADHEGELPPAPDVTVQAVRNLLKRESYHEARHERHLDRIDNLTRWLEEIDGGDNPIHDADRLRNMAFAALQGREAP